MNYLRGGLTAAYQYYRDLPPINAATLTGAIDVIVIQRKDEAGQLELACTPFHVRFGKWQILRPSEKKVSLAHLSRYFHDFVGELSHFGACACHDILRSMFRSMDALYRSI
jgi:phosphatidate phosphatase PAH1